MNSSEFEKWKWISLEAAVSRKNGIPEGSEESENSSGKSCLIRKRRSLWKWIFPGPNLVAYFTRTDGFTVNCIE